MVYGHVGNSAAVFPMQMKGISVFPVPTALLSNHPLYSTTYGSVLSSDWLSGLLKGVEDRGLITSKTIILSGYVGSSENAEIIAEFIKRARKIYPELIYVCDPTMGDDDLGLYTEESIVHSFRDSLVPLATIITPNQYELELLTNIKARTVEGIKEAGQVIKDRGTKYIVTTGCILADTKDGHVETTLLRESTFYRVSKPRLPIRPCGTGDLFTSFLVSRLCIGEPLQVAYKGATEEIYKVLLKTFEMDSEEMCIVGRPI